MRIAILSDIHDNIWTLESALKRARAAETMIFCGDFCAPFTLKQMAASFAKPIHAVFGNNDGDRFLLTKMAAQFSHVTLHGEFAEIEVGGRRIAVNHYPEIARAVAASGQYAAVFYGHNHTHKVERIGNTDLINPGEIMGRFGQVTFVFYDTERQQTETVKITA